MTQRIQASALPRAFRAAVAELSRTPWRPEIQAEEIPAPQRIAPHAVALEADVEIAGEEVGSGRLILLHDPAGNASWDGTFRCVTFAKATVDPSMVTDPLLPDVGWSWLIDALDTHEAAYRAPSGTVTAVSSLSFGQMADEPGRAEVEIRASWTPLLTQGRGLLAHVCAWQDLLASVSGLPPLLPGVRVLPVRRSRTR